MISRSKSGYRTRHPYNEVVFNANICTKDGTKVLYGDLDQTLDGELLQSCADDAQMDLYVLHEMDARFENEANPKLERAVKIYFSKAHSSLNDKS